MHRGRSRIISGLLPRPLPLVIIVLISISGCCFAVDGEDGGWKTTPESARVSTTKRVHQNCNIERHDAGELTQEEFLKRYAFSEPLVIYNLRNDEFREACRRDRMREEWKDAPVVLNSANTYSYARVPSTFGDYIENKLRPQDLSTLGNETLYLFGDIDQKLWAPLLELYRLPKWQLPDHSPALSFGMAGAGTGVPFHFHGPGFAEVIYGAKRWFLYAPDDRPEWDPEKSTLAWFLQDYPNLERGKRPLECDVHAGELIYFPDKWWHATLNLETSVFISTFLSP